MVEQTMVNEKLKNAINEFLLNRTSEIPIEPKYQSSIEKTDQITKQILELHPELRKLILSLSDSEGNAQAIWGDICYKHGWADCLQIMQIIGKEGGMYANNERRKLNIGKIKMQPELKIKGERIKKGLTQKDMAKKLGISETSYSLKESGKRSFTLNDLRIMCWYLNCDPNTLINIDQLFN